MIAPLRRVGVRWRLTLWYVGMLTVALLVFGGIVFVWQRGRIDAQVHSDIALLQRQAGQFPVQTIPILDVGQASDQFTPASAMRADDASDPMLTAELPLADASAPNIPVAVGTLPEIAMLVDPQGHVVRSSAPAGIEAQHILAQAAPGAVGPKGRAFPMMGLSGTSLPASDYQFYAQNIVVGDGGTGTLILGRPSVALGELQRLMVTLAAAGVVALLVVGAGGYWLAGRAMRPVQVITRAARDIEETDLSRRLDLPNHDELGELAATFDLMLARLDAAFRRQRQFTNDASHELRTPLTIIELEIARALARPGLALEQVDALTTIRSETAAMARLVQDLLTLARADASHAPQERQALDLGDLVLECVARFSALAQQRGVDISVADMPELTVLGDRSLLMQMFGNIIENAVKFTAGHGERVVLTGGVAAGRTAWVRVSDDGPGIPLEQQSSIFERFYRVDAARGNPDDAPRGSGLGLAIARWVAQAHSGEIVLESSEGHGATFEVRLPAFNPAAA